MPEHVSAQVRRILFAGYLQRGSSCVPRLQGLREIGLEVEEFESIDVYESPYRLVNSLAHRLFCTPRVVRKNRDLLDACRRHMPDLVWVEKGDWIFPSTLRRLRSLARYLVHYNTDDIFGTGSWFWLHRKGIPHYNLLLTTNRFNVAEMRTRYRSRTFRAAMGHDRDAHSPQPGQAEKKYDVVFVGHWERHSEEYISALRAAGIDARVWGPMWNRAAARAYHSIGPLDQDAYLKVLSQSRVALCSLSRRNRNESTGRSFEIPAVGISMLAEHTPEHAYLYKDGEEAMLFTGHDELVAKARTLLSNEPFREAVARAGQARLARLGLSWQDHVAREWPLILGSIESVDGTLTGLDDAPFWKGFRDGTPPPSVQLETMPVAV